MPDYLDIERFLNNGLDEKDLSFLRRISAAMGLLVARLVSDENVPQPRRDLFAKLATSIRQNCLELVRAHTDCMLPATAWAARNLLELMVWVRYCCACDANALRFQHDAFRDWADLVRASREIFEAILNEVSDLHDVALEQIREAAKVRFGIDNAESAFLSVSEAAGTISKETGLFFRKTNKILSKFAHPTAGLIDQIQNDELIINFTRQGRMFAFDASKTLLDSLVSSDSAR